jgi:hypothetical protein
MSAKMDRQETRLRDIIGILGLTPTQAGDAARELGYRFLVRGEAVYATHETLLALHLWTMEARPMRGHKAR